MGKAAAGFALAALVALGCRGERGSTPPGAPADTAAAGDSVATVVALQSLALRLEPSPESPPVLEVAPATPLRVLASRAGWVRAATWDGRAGWVPEVETLELALWVHYQQALGGASLSDLRIAYPLADGRWAVEARFPSGMTAASNVWIDGDPPGVIDVSGFESVPGACGAHRMAILAGRPAGESRTRGRAPALVRARLAIPGAPAPELRRLAVRRATPTPAQAQAIHELADRLAAAARGAGSAPETLAPAEWRAIGSGALWATLAGEPGRATPESGAWAGAVVLPGEAPDAEPLVVVEPYPAPGPPPALRLLAAFASGPADRPTLFVVERLDYDGRRVEVYVARAVDVRRLVAGYPWEC